MPKPTAKNEVPKGKKNPEIKAKEKKIQTLTAIKTLAESDGGKAVVDNLLKDILDITDWLGHSYKTATHAELMGKCAELESKQTIVRLITRAEWNQSVEIDELKEMIAEIPTDE